MNYKKIFSFVLMNFLIFPQYINAQIKIEIADGNSLARIGTFPPIQKADKKMALTFYNALSINDFDSINFVKNYYYNQSNNDITNKKLYSFYYWICRCINANKTELKKELNDPLSEDLFYFFTANHFEKLKEFLEIKYELLDNKLKNKNLNVGYYYDLMTLNAPNREDWEKTSEILNFLPLKKGDKVIDLGCGFGYYSFRLSKIVGDDGKVYATDINPRYINHLMQIIEKSGVKNIFPLITIPDDIGVRDSVDAVFICNLYHDLYTWMSDEKRSNLFISMKQSLKIGGNLILEGHLNANGEALNYSFIDKRLVIAQLAYWGFSYVDYKEFADQFYVITLKYSNEKVKDQILYANKKSNNESFIINVDSEKSLFQFYNTVIDNTTDTMNFDIENDEQKNLILKNMNLQKGQIIANIGSDRMYFSYNFSKLVGDRGKVYEIEPNDDQNITSKNFFKEQNIKNIEVIKYNVDTFSIKYKADIIFLCSFYFKLYLVFEENERKNFIESIIENMNTNGKLIIVDNGPANDVKLPYHENYINKKLIEYQLAFYGFELVNDVQITSQRYMLTFKIKGNNF